MLSELAASITTPVRIYSGDVREADSLHAAAEDFLGAFGAPDIVIANAGVSRGTLTEIAEDLPVFETILKINLTGVVATFQTFLNPMIAAKSGSLVGIASVAGFHGLPGASAYCASKAGLIAYLESLRIEMRPHNIKVSTICPGYIETPMTSVNPYPMPFMMKPDIAARKIIAAISQDKKITIIPWQMQIASILLRVIPRFLYDFLFSKAKHKPRDIAI
jgi:short-subunit dehydrogenase